MSWEPRVDLLGRTRQPLAGWTVLALGLALLLWQGLALWQEREALQAQQAGLTRLQRAAARQAAPAMSAADVQRHAQFEPVARHLAVPWQDLLDQVEQWAGSGVVLMRLTPDAETGRIVLAGRALTPEALARYVLVLEKAKALKDVQLLRHERDEENGGIEFDLEAAWVGVAPRNAPRAGAAR
jgi:hypothetical protein